MTWLTSAESESLVNEDNNQTPGGSHEIHNPIYRRGTRGDPYKPIQQQPLSYRAWVALSVFRRDDLKYAVKVGIGAIIYAMWSFIEPTRELYGHWRGEWGLLSYMLVCSMVCDSCVRHLHSASLTTCADYRRLQHYWISAICWYLPRSRLCHRSMDRGRRARFCAWLLWLACILVVFLHYCWQG